jgi:uncharacterized membrane protein
MTLATVTSYSFSIFLHITAVVIGMGATFAESVTFPVAMMTDKRHLPYVHRLQRAVNQWLTTPSLIVVIATGFYQTSKGDWSFGDAWISGSFVIVILIGGILGAYFIPEDRKLQAMAERDIASAPPGGEIVMSDEYMRRSRREGLIGAVTGLLVVAAIFLMVTKPGL